MILHSHTSHQEDQPILDITRLEVSYNSHPALEDISFHLHAGERVAVVGPNGAGKSTLFKVVAGVLPPGKGEVKIFGSRPGGHVCIAYIPQRTQVDWKFPVSVGDVVMMGRSAILGPLHWPKREDRDAVRAALATVELTRFAQRQISELSGGQQQRMFIARALAQEAELMLLDEPLNGLDSPAQESLLKLLDVLQAAKVTVMISTHNLDQAARYFDRILLLNRKIIGFGLPEDVLSSEKLLRAYGTRYRSRNGDDLLPLDDCCDDEV